jgi:hypothetical protein
MFDALEVRWCCGTADSFIVVFAQWKEKKAIHSLCCIFVLSAEKHGDRGAAGQEAESVGGNADDEALAIQSYFI